MQHRSYAVPSLDDLQALADSAAFEAEELFARIAHPIAQGILPKVGWDGAHAGLVV